MPPACADKRILDQTCSNAFHTFAEFAARSTCADDCEIKGFGLGGERCISRQPERKGVRRTVPAPANPRTIQRRSVHFLDAEQFVRMGRSGIPVMVNQGRMPHSQGPPNLKAG